MLMNVTEEKPGLAPSVTMTEQEAKGTTKALKRRKTSRGPAAEPKTEETPNDIIKPAATNKQLIAFLERIERVEEERTALSGDLKEIYAEVKACGFDTKIVRKLIALRKLDEQERLEADRLLATYMHAVGMAVQTQFEF